MKIQQVILQAMSGKLKWWEAAEIIGITDRTMRRWRDRYEEHGTRGLWDHRKGQPSPKRVPVKELETVLQLYRCPATPDNSLANKTGQVHLLSTTKSANG